jgi:hypothetical protein
MKMDGKTIVIIAVAIFVLYMLDKNKAAYMSYFTLEGAPIESSDTSSSNMLDKNNGKSNKSGPGAAMLPSEIPVAEDFSQFSTDYILSSQNYLDPRNQIGYPETVGGTLRNSNLQVRSEPPNPRDPVSIFNLSTISPEQMRPQFEIQDNDFK